jgi:hypothetical protein
MCEIGKIISTFQLPQFYLSNRHLTITFLPLFNLYSKFPLWFPFNYDAAENCGELANDREGIIVLLFDTFVVKNIKGELA